ncbi:unnamed protein product [Penicillium glandicola]
MLTQGPIESDPESRTDIPMVLGDFEFQTGLNGQDMSLASTTSVGTRPSTLAMSASTVKSGISANPEATGVGFPVWPDWLDWQDMNSASPTPPELPINTLTEHMDVDPLDMTSSTAADSNSNSNSKIKMTDPIRAELDQLYFDRVHAICPIIHRRRYFAMVTQDNHTPAQICLRSAMQTLAAAMSAHWCHLSEQLYSETRSLLENQSQMQATPRDKVALSQIQTWLLLSHYELLRIGIHQAMLSAGRAFRLVQMARLSNIDAPGGDLQISPRLPAPEENFQDNQPTRISFLPEAIAQTGPSTLSPFAECIVMATLHGRCMTHRRSYANESETGTRDFCIRQEWLATAVEKRVQTLVPSPAIDSDPMLLFTHMLAYRATVDLSNTVQRASWRTADQQVLITTYQNRAAQAASEIVRLAKAVPYLSPFKAHPFLPDTLACAATFLATHAGSRGGDYDSVQRLLRVLGQLQDTHSLARDSLQILKLQDTRG